MAFLGEKRLVFFARKERERRIYPGKGKTRKGQRINCPLKPCIGYKNGKNKLERDRFIEAPSPSPKICCLRRDRCRSANAISPEWKIFITIENCGGNSCERRGKRGERGVFLNEKKKRRKGKEQGREQRRKQFE